MQNVHSEDALNFLIEMLLAVPGPGLGQAKARQTRAQGSDIWIDLVGAQYWQARSVNFNSLSQDEKEPHIAPFYDAAWELCRRGVLRPAAAVPAGQSAVNHIGARENAAPFFGDGYSLTLWGREWIRKAASERAAMPSDPSRLSEVLGQFKPLFGSGYAQRAVEAVSDWRTGNFLSACTMAGAAAESILLATAIAKSKDEPHVLNQYRSARGRTNVMKAVTAGVQPSIGDRFNSALGVLAYWRDEAGHGTASAIGEIEAHEALSRLLRLAQFTSDNWSVLTAQQPQGAGTGA